jgi:hypothetical protein
MLGMICASVLALVVLTLLPVHAAYGQSPEEVAMQQIRPEAIRAHMRFLADDMLEGRGTGTRGYELAAKYVATQFEALGLEPAGIEHTYYQPVPLRKVELAPEHSSIALVRNSGEDQLTYEKDFAMPGSPMYPDITVRASVVFVGFGVNAPDLGYNDYAGADVHGRVVAVMYGAPPRFPSAERVHYSAAIVKAQEAAAHGAVGIIVLWVGEREKRTPFQRIVGFMRAPAFRWLDAQGMPNDVHAEIRGTVWLGPEGAHRLFEGAPKPLHEAIAVGAAGKAQSFALPVTVSIHTATRHVTANSPNVIAVLRGSDPKLRDEYVVYTAHTDHLGIGPAVDGDSIYNGAVDNASGTAELIEVARAFSQLPHSPRRSLLFVAVTGEEAGLIGSDYFAHNPTVPLRGMVANINMDSPTLSWDFRDIIALGEEHSSLGRIVRQAARRMDLELSPDPLPEEVYFIRSDQYSFVRQGVPAVAIAGGAKAIDPKIDVMKVFQEWQMKIYHTPKDDMNQPLNFDAAVRLTRINFLVGYLTAESDERPVWKPGDFFGKMFGRKNAP